MTTSTTFNVHFWLKANAIKKNGELPIYARITVDGRRADLSTKQSIPEEKWCPIARRMKPRYSGAKAFNDSLDGIYSKLGDSYKHLEDRGVVITAQAVKLKYLGKDKPVLTLNDLIEFHNDGDLKKLGAGTAKNYPATERYLRRFLWKEYNCTDIYLKKIGYTFIADFEEYLWNCTPLNKSRPLGNNGIMKHMERFQKLTNLALKHKWILDNPFSLYQLKFEEYDSDFLEEWEIDAIRSLRSNNKSILKVRDVFVFSCYTGLCYIEVRNLSQKDVVEGIDGGQWITIRRQKTKAPVKQPLLDEANEILEAYRDYPCEENGGRLLPVFSSQVINRYLKTIAELCGIDKKLTFHVARHTFATTVTLLNDVPIATVSKLLGHKKLSTTQKYARVIEKKISEDMKGLKAKLKSNSRKKICNSQTQSAHLRVV